MKIQRWLLEPLVHFLFLGALLFLIFHVVKGGSTGSKEKVVVTAGTIRTISENFQRVWQRPPASQELQSLVQDYIKDEIYSREAVKLGLDQDDAVIRRRLRQKMEFLSDGIAASAEPSEKELQAYLEKHPEKFRIEPRYSFSQVYLNPDRRGSKITHDSTELLAKLNQAGASVDASEYGDPFMLGYNFSNVPETNVARNFGDQFAKNLAQLEKGKWTGPVESGYGLHLVFINDRTEGEIPVLSDIRNQVQREWMVEQQEQSSEKFFQSLRDRYVVTIEQPSKAPDNKTPAVETQP